MKLSIVIPSSVRVDLLERCLRTVQAFSPPGTEWIVVDDGSTDAAVSRTASHFPDVRIIRHSKPMGFCTAVNCGVEAASGDVVELLNDDARVTSRWAEPALARFRDDAVVAVAPLILQDGSDSIHPLIDSAGDDYDPGGFARKRGHGTVYTQGGEFGHATTLRSVSACAGFFRRAAYLQAGGMPESFGAYFDDVDLSCRLRLIGELWYEPNSVVWHSISSSYGKKPGPRLLRQQSRNEELLFWRNLGGPQRFRYLMRHSAVLCGKILKRLAEGRLSPWIRGRTDAWRLILNNYRAENAR